VFDTANGLRTFGGPISGWYDPRVTSIELDNVTVSHSGVPVVREVSLEIADEELLVVIGPSGSGKSTLLRAVAGLDSVTHGRVLFDGEDVTGHPPYVRNISMVFQDSTPLPLKTVRGNISFPLEIQGVDQEEVDRRVLAQARALAIDRFLDRMPAELSAGHGQLVQAARALVRRPSVFLLDEPLAHMDAADRRMMRSEIRVLQRGYGVTMLYATNSDEEAMVLADRIVVIRDGRVRQVASPGDVYRRPADAFIAGFVGSPPMSFVQGEILDSEVRFKAGALPLPSRIPNGPVSIGVRNHDWESVSAAGLRGVVMAIEDLGDHRYATVDLQGDDIIMRVTPDGPSVGELVEIWTHRFHIFGPSGRAIAHVSSRHKG
jgi:ABC-type sugar transport system ATPase subunit